MGRAIGIVLVTGMGGFDPTSAGRRIWQRCISELRVSGSVATTRKVTDIGLAKGWPHSRWELELGVPEEDAGRALKEMISPLGRLWIYASSFGRRYDVWRWLS